MQQHNLWHSTSQLHWRVLNFLFLVAKFSQLRFSSISTCVMYNVLRMLWYPVHRIVIGAAVIPLRSVVLSEIISYYN